MQPACELCNQAIPEGVESMIEDGLTICGPCLWDGYTPLWRLHLRHDAPYSACEECLNEITLTFTPNAVEVLDGLE